MELYWRAPHLRQARQIWRTIYLAWRAMARTTLAGILAEGPQSLPSCVCGRFPLFTGFCRGKEILKKVKEHIGLATIISIVLGICGWALYSGFK